MVITSACHAEGPGSIPGNSVKMWTALPHFGVAGSIPASSFWDCSSDGRARGKRSKEHTSCFGRRYTQQAKSC